MLTPTKRGPPNPSDAVNHGATPVVKFRDPADYPELAANEYFCLRVVQKLNVQVPDFKLSDDGAVLIIAGDAQLRSTAKQSSSGSAWPWMALAISPAAMALKVMPLPP